MIHINGKQYPGNNLTINDNKVIIDGKVVEEDKFELTLAGEIENFNCDQSITVKGDLYSKNVNLKGSLNCKDVTGAIEAKGSVNCDGIDGDVKAGGSINCDDIDGNAKAGGSISCDRIEGKILD